MPRHPRHHIAIIGMGCIFPESRNLKEFWRLLASGRDAIREIPEDTHWNIKDYFDKDPSAEDHIYCTRGGFLPDIIFDPTVYGIPPNNLEATDTSQLLGLEVARMALKDAGYPAGHSFLKEKKVNVILGVTGTQELVIPLGARLGHPIWEKAINDAQIPEDKKEEIIARIKDGYVPWQENSFPGLLGNVVAGRIANRLDLSGTNTVTDAACASSLSAIHTAVMELITGKCDMSITGGVDALNDIFMHMCFAKTGVLSHTSDARPFSEKADGTVLGEGVGMLVLKRLDDAVKAKDRIYAVIKGIGTSSDGKTSAIYAPDAQGQLKALKQAYSEADIDPATVGFVEAHGTGTRVGDKVEFNALKKCYSNSGQPNRTALGSVKSMIGHTKAAAGAAGIIKAALSLHHKALLPTLKAENPDPDLNIQDSAFYLNNTTKPWLESENRPRRSAVSAFGFGGSNFHAVLEEYTPKKTKVSWDGYIEILAFSADTKERISEQIQTFDTLAQKAEDPSEKSKTIAWQAARSRHRFSSDHKYRLTAVYSKDTDIHELLSQARSCLKENKSAGNIYIGSDLPEGQLGFLFPGQGSQYTGMAKDLFTVFPEAVDALEQAREKLAHIRKDPDNLQLDHYMFPLPEYMVKKADAEDALRQTDVAQIAIGSVSLAMLKILSGFGVKPDAACGHSYGELSALMSAGWMDEETFLHMSAARGKYMAKASQSGEDAGSMLAVRGKLEKIDSLIKEEGLDLVLANRNSYTQGIVSGPTEQIKQLQSICKKRKLRAVPLPVAAAFHSRFVQKAATPFKAELKDKTFSATDIPVFSNTTGLPYPEKEKEIKQILGNQLAHPVNFVENLEQMFNSNVKTFIEVGPKSVLTGLARQVFKDRDVQTISLDASMGKNSGIEDLAHTLSLLAAEGRSVDLTKWEESADQPEARKMKIHISGANLKPKSRYQAPVKRQKKSEIKPDTIKPDSNQKIEPPKGSIQYAAPDTNLTRTTDKGLDMKPSQTPYGQQQPAQPASQPVDMIQKGFEAIAQLQAQTARAHEKFLDTQAEASKTLARMLEHSRGMTSGYTAPTESRQPLVQAPPVFENAVPAPSVPATSVAPAPEAAAAVEPVPATVEPVPAQPAQKSSPALQSSRETSSQTDVEPILFEIVSELTGFPVEMLESGMDIESDLGIDSIKKVEIISELEKKIPSCQGLSSENIGQVKTLKDICQAIAGQTATTKETGTASQPAPEALAPEKQPSGDASVERILMATISELTGFPVEMLELDMDLESDLGIDSIKRVEILSKLEQQLPDIENISPDEMTGLKTIGDITGHLTRTSDLHTADTKKKLKNPS